MSDFRNLFLLIGTNPLPNYVVAKYFIDNNKSLDNIYFVHSIPNASLNQSSTKNLAENIVKVLKKNGLKNNINIHFIPIENIEEKQSITNSIQNYLNKNGIQGKIHLNYTGGTKQMGIHSNEFYMSKYFSDTYKTGEVQRSYLSARNFKLIDGNDTVICNGLINKVIINFEDLISLHGFNRTNEDKEFNYQEALILFEDFITKETLDEFYNEYKRKDFEDEKESLLQNYNKGKDKLGKLNLSGKLLEVSNAYQNEYKIFDDRGKFLENLSGTTKVKDNKVKYGIKFLDGDWLEEYVYKVLFEDDEIKKLDPLKNWVIKKSDWPDKLDFELDILLINGYQLIGISCTTSDDKRICKSKGFEISLRTKQIGGDEAKSVLISRLTEENTDKLQLELETDTGSTGNILILGKKDLKKGELLKKIKKFLRSE